MRPGETRRHILKRKQMSLGKALTRCQTTFLRLPNIEEILSDERGVSKALEDSGLPMFVDDMVITRNMYRNSRYQHLYDGKGNDPQACPSGDQSERYNSESFQSGSYRSGQYHTDRSTSEHYGSSLPSMASSLNELTTAVPLTIQDEGHLAPMTTRSRYSFAGRKGLRSPEITASRIEFLLKERRPVTRLSCGMNRAQVGDYQIVAQISDYLEGDEANGLRGTAEARGQQTAARTCVHQNATETTERQNVAQRFGHQCATEANEQQNVTMMNWQSENKKENKPNDEHPEATRNKDSKQAEKPEKHEPEAMDTGDHVPTPTGKKSILDLDTICDSAVKGLSKSLDCFRSKPLTLKEFLLLS